MKIKLMVLLSFVFLLLGYNTGFAFNNADLKKFKETKKCEGGTFSSCDLQGVVLKNMNLSNARLQGANLRGATLENIVMTKANLEGADLEGAKLRFVNFDGSSMNEVNLTKTTMLFIDFSNASMEEAFVTGSIMKGITFHNTNLSDVVFDGLDLHLVDFSGARGINDKPCQNGSFGSCK